MNLNFQRKQVSGTIWGKSFKGCIEYAANYFPATFTTETVVVLSVFCLGAVLVLHQHLGNRPCIPGSSASVCHVRVHHSCCSEGLSFLFLLSFGSDLLTGPERELIVLSK